MICPMKPLQPPYPKYYNASAKCDYHGGAIGHSTENYQALKFNVQSLIDSGWLTFQEEKSSIDKNPLSGHANALTNAVMDKEGQSLVRRVDGIRSSLKDVFIELCHTSLSKFEYKPEYTCGFHSSTEHYINECSDFKIFLQNLMDRHILKVYHQNLEEEVFLQTGEELSMTRPKPLVIRFIKTHLCL